MFGRIRNKFDIFHISSILIGCLIVIPLIGMLLKIDQTSATTWQHIREVMLLEFITNSLILVLGVALLGGVIGLLSAYLVARYDFRSRNVLKWMMILPLAMPSYIAAYLYADMFSFTGSITRLLRVIGWNRPVDILNMGGAIIIFALTLFPYVYVVTLSALTEQSAAYEDSARLLGASKKRTFFSVTLPLIRPALIAGVLLMVLETLNDYGVVSYFNVRVFSFAIFNAWFSLDDLGSAIRLSGYLMFFVLLIIMIERLIRGRRKFHIHVKTKPVQAKRLVGIQAFMIPSILWLILFFAFILPVVQLLWHLSLTLSEAIDIRVLHVTLNSLSIGLVTALIIVIAAVLLSNMNRMRPSLLKKSWLRLTNLGYAIPGAVIAIAVHLFFVDIDRTLYPIYRLLDPNSPVLVLSLGLGILIFAYVLRFMAIGYNTIESSYDKIGTVFTEASYVLNQNKWMTLFKTDLPLIKPGLISAMILVFIDVIKELPLTLILRPANYETLSSLVYVYASDEMLPRSSLASLILIGVSAVLIYLLTHTFKKEKRHVS